MNICHANDLMNLMSILVSWLKILRNDAENNNIYMYVGICCFGEPVFKKYKTRSINKKIYLTLQKDE